MEEVVEVESVRVELKLSELTSGESRSEQLYGTSWKQRVLNTKDLPQPDVMYVNCPRHAEYLMTPIKIFKSAYGYSITFQCHHANNEGDLCLIIAQINESTLGSKVFMRPGDILDFEGWDKALDRVQQINLGDKVSDPETTSQNITITEVPPNPYKPNTVLNIVWDTFWDNILANGYCSYNQLQNEIREKKGDDKSMRQLRDYVVGNEQIADWMSNRTGFVFKKFGDSWKVVGRTEGQEGSSPWSDEGYQERFGFNGG